MTPIRLIPLAACLALALACHHESAPSSEHKEPEKPSPVSHNEAGETVIKLDADTIKRIDLKLAPLAAADFSPEAKGFGRVLDPAPLTALVGELATAHLAVENSRRELGLAQKRREGELALARASLKLSEASVQPTKAQGEAELAAAQVGLRASSLELERAKTLAKQNNVSERALQAAEAAAAKDNVALASAKLGGTRANQTAELAVQKDRLQVELTDATTANAVQAAEAAVHRDEVAAVAVRAKLATAYGRMLMDHENLVEFAHALVVGQMALVRLDVPAGEPLKAAPAGVHLISPSDTGAVIPAQLLGPAGGTDAQLQGQGFLLLVPAEAARLTPGTLITGFLRLPGEVEHGVTVPRSAIVRHEGEAFIYLATKEGEFTRKEIELEHATPGGWFVHEGLKAGEKIVVTGAQQLLSEESKGKD